MARIDEDAEHCVDEATIRNGSINKGYRRLSLSDITMMKDLEEISRKFLDKLDIIHGKNDTSERDHQYLQQARNYVQQACLAACQAVTKNDENWFPYETMETMFPHIQYIAAEESAYVKYADLQKQVREMFAKVAERTEELIELRRRLVEAYKSSLEFPDDLISTVPSMTHKQYVSIRPAYESGDGDVFPEQLQDLDISRKLNFFLCTTIETSSNLKNAVISVSISMWKDNENFIVEVGSGGKQFIISTSEDSVFEPVCMTIKKIIRSKIHDPNLL